MSKMMENGLSYLVEMSVKILRNIEGNNTGEFDNFVSRGTNYYDFESSLKKYSLEDLKYKGIVYEVKSSLGVFLQNKLNLKDNKKLEDIYDLFDLAFTHAIIDTTHKELLKSNLDIAKNEELLSGVLKLRQELGVKVLSTNGSYENFENSVQGCKKMLAEFYPEYNLKNQELALDVLEESYQNTKEDKIPEIKNYFAEKIINYFNSFSVLSNLMVKSFNNVSIERILHMYFETQWWAYQLDWNEPFTKTYTLKGTNFEKVNPADYQRLKNTFNSSYEKAFADYNKVSSELNVLVEKVHAELGNPKVTDLTLHSVIVEVFKKSAKSRKLKNAMLAAEFSNNLMNKYGLYVKSVE